MRQLSIIVLAVFFSGNLFAQQRGNYSNFMLNEYYYNPAVAGSKDYHLASISYRNQWVGFEGAPDLLLGNFYGSAKNKGKHGYGVSLISEKQGITQNTGFYLNYAYHIKLGEKIKLGLGVQPGYMQYRVKLYDAILADQGDATLTGSVYSANAIDVSAGFNLYSERFYLMGSAHHLLGRGIQFTSYNSNLTFHYDLIAGYTIRFKKKKFELQPSVLFRYTEPVPFQVTGMLKGTLHGKYWLGLLYRTYDAAGISLGAMIKERFGIGYGFDYSLSKISNYQNGTHEINLYFIVNRKKPSLDDEDDKLNNSIMEEMKNKMDK